METSTLAFFIGIQNLCLNHNKMITSVQWMMGNSYFILAAALAIFLFYAVRKGVFPKAYHKFAVGFLIFTAVYFVGYNFVSLSMPIDEREAMEEVINKKPELAQKVRYELDRLKKIGNDFH
ncbi:MAG: hypothetical protein WBM07_00135 [Chitinivibrionales bacterium]|jgi:hypothetical protein